MMIKIVYILAKMSATANVIGKTVVNSFSFCKTDSSEVPSSMHERQLQHVIGRDKKFGKDIILITS